MVHNRSSNGKRKKTVNTLTKCYLGHKNKYPDWMKKFLWAGGIKSSCGHDVLCREMYQSLCGIESLLWAGKGEDLYG